MESLKVRCLALQQALLTLKKGIDNVQHLETIEQIEMRALIRDGIIQRFEYCIDSFWKFLKLYLEIKQMQQIESSSPRSILHMGFNSKIITKIEFEMILKALSARNLTSHTYNEELADTIFKNIAEYYEVMSTIVMRLFNEILEK